MLTSEPFTSTGIIIGAVILKRREQDNFKPEILVSYEILLGLVLIVKLHCN